MTSYDITPAQSRAARGLLGWTQPDLAKAANVGTSTLADFERGARVPVHNNLLAIRRALEEAGVEFVADADREGVVLRRKVKRK